jgi:hypothetical protein
MSALFHYSYDPRFEKNYYAGGMATLESLFDERLLELAWEGWRRQDMIRFGKYHQAYDQRPQLTGEKNGFTTVFPIPQHILDLNPNLTQNKGYD